MSGRTIAELESEYEAVQARLELQRSVVRDLSRAANNAAIVCGDLTRASDKLARELKEARRAARRAARETR